MIVFRIREIAKMNRVDMQKVSQLSGISSSALYKIDRGAVAPKFETILQISKALGVSLYDLFYESD